MFQVRSDGLGLLLFAKEGMAGTLGATRFYACARHGARARHTRTHTARRGCWGSARTRGGAAVAASSSRAASAGCRLSSSSGSGRERGGAGRRSGRGRRGPGLARRSRASGPGGPVPELGAEPPRLSEPVPAPPARRSRASLAGGRLAAALPPPSLHPSLLARPARVPFFPGAELGACTPAPPESSSAAGPDLPPPAGAPPAELAALRGAQGWRPWGSAPARGGGNRRPLLAGSPGGAPGRPVKDAIVAAERIGPQGGIFFPFCRGWTSRSPL